MPKNDSQPTANAAPSSVPGKRPGVRTLQSLEDLRRLQSKLLRQFLSGELDEKTYRAAVYGCATLAGTMRELKPGNGMEGVVTTVIVSPCSEEEESFIKEMNTAVMDAPEENR
jgi:hypothetical protein